MACNLDFYNLVGIYRRILKLLYKRKIFKSVAEHIIQPFQIQKGFFILFLTKRSSFQS